MRCVICRNGSTESGKTTVTLERGSLTVVIRGVPAQVCTTCGEAYVNKDAAARLLESAEQASRTGAQVEIRDYAVA